MLSYVRLINFKSFSDITLDLRGTRGIPKQLAVIYGENGAGKSNLISALLFLSRSIATMRNQEESKKMSAEQLVTDLGFISNSKNRDQLAEKIFRSFFYTLKDEIEQAKSIARAGAMTVETGFYLGGREGVYSMVFKDERIVKEELRHRIHSRIGTVFSVEPHKVTLSPSVFTNASYRKDLQANIKKYWGNHTFMSILFHEQATINREFLTDQIEPGLFEIMNWLHSLSVFCSRRGVASGRLKVDHRFLTSLDAGKIDADESRQLEAFETGLNTFFTQLYSDIQQVYYKKQAKKNTIEYQLFVRKTQNNEAVDIPFTQESTGTQKLLEIFPYLYLTLTGTTVLIDEIDSGIHDLLMLQLMEIFREALALAPEGQLIITTHNTLLLNELPKNNIYVIRADAVGNRKITSIDQYEFRTQATHSVQAKYLRGDYEGIPYSGHLDFSDLMAEVRSSMVTKGGSYESQK